MGAVRSPAHLGDVSSKHKEGRSEEGGGLGDDKGCGKRS